LPTNVDHHQTHEHDEDPRQEAFGLVRYTEICHRTRSIAAMRSYTGDPR